MANRKQREKRSQAQLLAARDNWNNKGKDTRNQRRQRRDLKRVFEA